MTDEHLAHNDTLCIGMMLLILSKVGVGFDKLIVFNCDCR